MIRKLGPVYLLAAALLVPGILTLWLFLFPAEAQSAQNSWSSPTNISRSGSTSDPRIVVDSNQNVHIIWVDAFSDYGYAFFNGETWSDPVGLSYIFYPYIPTLVAGSNGLVHIFWVTDEGSLLYSRSSGDNMGNPAAWAPPVVLASGVLNFHASTDDEGRLHLGYVQGPNENGIPTGIYYRQADPTGIAWSPNAPVYLSPYFRAVTAEDAHVFTATTQVDGTTRVYLTFDNSPLKRVFMASSMDNGATWSEPLEVDRPDQESITTTPFDIIVYPDQQNILLMWKDNLQSGFNCTQYYQYSTDGGSTWSERGTTFNELVGCPFRGALFPGPENSVLFFADIADTAYIEAWDWGTWSDPQIQSAINQFTDPNTFSDLRLENKKAAMAENFQLYVTASDSVGNHDVWAMARSVEDITEWYPLPNAWQAPTTVVGTAGEILDPVIISDASGIFHLFWSQSANPEDPSKDWRVFYTQFDGVGWLAPVDILASPDKHAVNLSAATDENRKIYVTWEGANSGEIYFAWAESDKASSVFEWSEPQLIPQPPFKAAEPVIYSGLNDILYITYTVPFNEGRGVYLTQSSDQGQTWSTPELIFDGVAANWSVVGKAEISQTQDGNLHALFSQKNMPGDDSAISLYYMRTLDGESTWSAPTLAIDQPINASNILAADQLTIHRYWQTDAGLESSIWHEVSLDAGLTWITSAPISNFGTPGPSDMVLDSNNRLHLIQRYSDSEGMQFLQHWEWSGSSWESQGNLNESNQIFNLATSLTASSNLDGRLVAVSQEQQADLGTEVLTNYLISTNRLLDDQLPQVTPIAVLPGPTATMIPETPISSIETQENPLISGSTPITGTPTPLSFENSEVVNPTSSSLIYLIFGVGSALLIIILLLGFRYWREK